LLRSKVDSSLSISENTNDYFSVTVLFHTHAELELEIPTWFRGFDLVKLIAQKIYLDESCDFRLFETDKHKEKISPLLEDEIIF